jgi:hypothetical protein
MLNSIDFITYNVYFHFANKQSKNPKAAATTNTMKKVMLQFPSLIALIDFAIIADGKNCKFDLLNFTLDCVLDEDDTELALNNFQATPLKLQELMLRSN